MNTTLTRYILRDIGWLKKASEELKDFKKQATAWDALKASVPYIALATGIGALGTGLYHANTEHKELGDVASRENNRELIGAMNDTVVRQKINDLYNAVGLNTPEMPLAVSKEVSPMYKAVVGQMNG